MTSKQLATFLLLLCGLFMITANLNRGFSADEESGSTDSGGDKSDSGGDSNDGGGKEDSKESNDGGGDDGSNSQQEDEGKTSGEDKQEDRGVLGEEKPIDHEKLKGTPEEQEKAAIEDYIYDEPGYVKPYPPVINPKPKPGVGEPIERGPIHVKQRVPGFEESKPDWCKKHDCGKGHDGDNWDHDHDHHHNNWCDHHDCHHHNHHSSTHFSDNHNGDVTVKVHVTDYKNNDLNDVHLIIGDVYEKNLDLSSEPDTIKVDNLDIDGGDDFGVCLANEDSDEGDCVVTHADDDHDTVEVKLKVL